MSSIVTADLVPLRDRGFFTGITGVYASFLGVDELEANSGNYTAYIRWAPSPAPSSQAA